MLHGDWLRQKALAQYKQCCRQHPINILNQSVPPTGREGKIRRRSSQPGHAQTAVSLVNVITKKRGREGSELLSKYPQKGWLAPLGRIYVANSAHNRPDFLVACGHMDASGPSFRPPFKTSLLAQFMGPGVLLFFHPLSRLSLPTRSSAKVSECLACDGDWARRLPWPFCSRSDWIW